MTNEEAIKIINNMPNYKPWEVEALAMAIKALKQQPCEDCISRAEIKKFINTQLTNNEELASSATNESRWVEEEKYLYGVEILEGLSEYVNDLPSVTLQRPKGKWIKTEGSFKCSECLTFPEYIRTLNYCPSCGSYNGGGEKMKIKNKIIRELVAIVITVVVILIPIVVHKDIHWDSYDSVLVLNTILFFDIMFVHRRVQEWLNRKGGEADGNSN